VQENLNYLDKTFWNNRWLNNQTGWDIGYAAPAISNYFSQVDNKNAAILIPGCGNAYEAEDLVKKGFNNITLVDIAPKAVEILQQKFINTPQVKVICTDFFEHDGRYDYIVEQTFFCTFYPEVRKKYAAKAASLLNKNSKIIGLLFNKEFENNGPPFGGSELEYKKIFETEFILKTMSICTNSISPRHGSELFITLIKK